MRHALFALLTAYCFLTLSSAQTPFGGDSSLEIGGDVYDSHQLKVDIFEHMLDKYISGKMQEADAVGLSIAVVEGDNVIYKKGFGYADVENEIPVTSSTIFHVGSITKVFTGIAIMQLVQKGLICLDAPLQWYLPEFAIKYHLTTGRPITIRSIMAHQSGIFGDKRANSRDTVYPEEDFRTYAAFARNEYAAYHPNYITAYSNFAVSLLGDVIERVSHQKYEDYIKNNILQPCGMTESGFDTKNTHNELLAKGYDAGGNLSPYIYYATNPAGFLASNGDNMARFIKMILKKGRVGRKRILHPRILQSMFRSQGKWLPMNLCGPYSSTHSFGLSWKIENQSFGYLGKVVGHDGQVVSYQSNLLIAKDQNIGVFVTANKDNFSPSEIACFALVQAAKIFRQLDKPALPPVPPVTAIPDHVKNWCTGTYCMLGWYPIEIYSENDTLYFHHLHNQRIPLVCHTDGRLSLYVNNSPVPGYRISIQYKAGRKVLCVESRDNFTIQENIEGMEFIPDGRIVPEVLGLYNDISTGIPALVVMADTLSISRKPFMRAIEISTSLPFVLKPGESSTFTMQGLGRFAQETMYMTGDTINYWGYKYVKASEISAEQGYISSSAGNTPSTMTKEQIIADMVKLFTRQFD